jgi:hypothetical protein
MGMNWYRLDIDHVVCKTEGCVALYKNAETLIANDNVAFNYALAA